jgi:hypothetical protein
MSVGHMLAYSVHFQFKSRSDELCTEGFGNKSSNDRQRTNALYGKMQSTTAGSNRVVRSDTQVPPPALAKQFWDHQQAPASFEVMSDTDVHYNNLIGQFGTLGLHIRLWTLFDGR